MSRIYAVANQKGGVGKSTTALAMGAGLAEKKKRVLWVDLDPQGNLSYTMQADPSAPNAHHLLLQQASPEETIQNTPGGDLIAASPLLSAADIELTVIGKEYRLKEALGQIRNRYDYIIIDTPPALGILTVNALTAADGVVIPAHADIYSLQGVGQLYSTIQAVRAYCNPELAIDGILLTRHNTRAILSRDLAEMLRNTAQQMGTRVYETGIRENISLKEAQSARQDIFSYAPKSNAAQDYSLFIKELISQKG